MTILPASACGEQYYNAARFYFIILFLYDYNIFNPQQNYDICFMVSCCQGASMFNTFHLLDSTLPYQKFGWNVELNQKYCSQGSLNVKHIPSPWLNSPLIFPRQDLKTLKWDFISANRTMNFHFISNEKTHKL